MQLGILESAEINDGVPLSGEDKMSPSRVYVHFLFCIFLSYRKVKKQYYHEKSYNLFKVSIENLGLNSFDRMYFIAWIKRVIFEEQTEPNELWLKHALELLDSFLILNFPLFE